ncbi:hypothetical protein [Bacillus smithii]|uniref:hypothetical protein n=1 Tax=Bacillus smithii TaxID=1479 RepID=UPI003D1FE885
MKFEVNYCRDFGGKVGDQWLWKTIKAESEEEARDIIFEEYKAKYIVSIAPINDNKSKVD